MRAFAKKEPLTFRSSAASFGVSISMSAAVIAREAVAALPEPDCAFIPVVSVGCRPTLGVPSDLNDENRTAGHIDECSLRSRGICRVAPEAFDGAFQAFAAGFRAGRTHRLIKKGFKSLSGVE